MWRMTQENLHLWNQRHDQMRGLTSGAALSACSQRKLKWMARPTVWCQQHDPLTLEPASARNYEMPSKCGAESAVIMTFLMDLPNPDSRTVAAVHAAADWFKKLKSVDVVWDMGSDDGRKLSPKPGGGPLWARYYDLKTDRPIFGDRDKTIHDDVSEISKERRNGYSWFQRQTAKDA